MILAQAVDAVADAASSGGRLLGLTVMEWGILLGFLSTFVGAIVKHLQATAGARKVEAVVHALEEASADHPAAIKLAKRLARAKATALGVETGIFGLGRDVSRHTERLRKPKRPENGQ